MPNVLFILRTEFLELLYFVFSPLPSLNKVLARHIIYPQMLWAGSILNSPSVTVRILFSSINLEGGQFICMTKCPASINHLSGLALLTKEESLVLALFQVIKLSGIYCWVKTSHSFLVRKATWSSTIPQRAWLSWFFQFLLPPVTNFTLQGKTSLYHLFACLFCTIVNCSFPIGA